RDGGAAPVVQGPSWRVHRPDHMHSRSSCACVTRASMLTLTIGSIAASRGTRHRSIDCRVKPGNDAKGCAPTTAELSVVTTVMGQPKDYRMQLSSTLSWLVDKAGETPGADRLLAELGAHLLKDGLPLAGGALTLAVAHPLIARRTWLWRADSGEVIEALAFALGVSATDASPSNDAGPRWLAGIAKGVVHEDTVGPRPDGPLFSWIGPRQFTRNEAKELTQAARFAAAPLAALAARA